MKRNSVFARLAVGLSLSSSPGLASDAARADELFDEGKALMEAGEFDQACPKLEQSLKEEVATGTLLALALCQERTGALASAWRNYTHAAERAQSEENVERERAARARALALVPQLSTLTLLVPADVAALPGLEAWLGERRLPVPPGMPVPADPGEHVVRVTAPGYRAFEKRIVVDSEARALSVSVPVLDPLDDASAAERPRASTPPHAAPQARPPAPNSADHATSHDPGAPLRTAGLISAGTGLVGLGLGTYFGLRAGSLKDDSNAPGRCDGDLCDAEGERLRNSALAAADVSSVAFVAGGVLAAGGIALYFIGKSQQKPTRVGVVPMGHAGVGVLVSGGL